METTDNSSGNPELRPCVFSIPTRHIYTAWFTVYLLFLPVFLFVLYIGFNKWKKPQSGGLSHSDIFTLNMVAMEMASIVGACVVFYSYYTLTPEVLSAAEIIYITTFMGQMLFHSLTCVERYLAVVHPVTYLRLRREGGVTAKTVAIALVWVSSVIYSLVFAFFGNAVVYGSFSLAVFITLTPVVVYCSIYVLCVLIRPKPGEKGGLRKQIDQSKRSTVYIMVAILGALLLRLMVIVIYGCGNLWFGEVGLYCLTIAASLWVALPSSLVLPLLFLHRAGKLTAAR